MIDATQMAGYMTRLVRESGKTVTVKAQLTVGDNKFSNALELTPDDTLAPGLADKMVGQWLDAIGFTCMALAEKAIQKPTESKSHSAPQ